MRMPRPAVLLSFLALTALPVSAQVTPQTLSKLEARRQAKPNDARVLRDLGIALFKLKRYSDAREALSEGTRLNPKDGVTALYLGMSAEEMNDLTAARQAYTTYLATGKTKGTKDAVAQRLALLTQRELKAQAAAAVAQEQRLAGQPGTDMTIAVLPLSVSGPAGNQYEPLGRGLAELMIADFAKVTSLKLLERERIQALLDEIALGRSNNVDRATAARSGRLLQAGRLVTGAIVVPSAQNVQINASVVSVSNSAAQSGGAAGGSLNQIFDYEKEVVLETLDSMKVQVPADVRAQIRGNRPTTNLQAFLAYSRGLVSSDAGRLDEAANFFDQARALDPNFAAAAQQAATARTASAGQQVTTARIEATLRGSSEGQIVSAAETGATGTGPRLDALGSTLQNVLADVNPSTADAITRVAGTPAVMRDPQSSATSTDGSQTTRTGTVTIVIKRP